MERGPEEFERLVTAVVVRFSAQASRPAPPAQLPRFAAQLWRVVLKRGLPRPLREGESGTPGGMTELECAPLVAEVMAGLDELWLAEVARALLKACLYPEFTACRDSFREVGRDGSCRRQELARALGRISGAHCVDCPYWVALDAAEGAELLARNWHHDRQVLAANLGSFLPEDFRALRVWLHATARGQAGAN